MRVSLRKTSIWPLLAPLALCVQGCGGGGGSAGGSSGIAPAPSPTATPAPSPSPTPAPSPGPAPTPTPTPTPTSVPATFAEYATSLYDVQPDLAGCKPGVLKASVKADLLTRLNAIRALHNLPAVTYSQAEDAAEQDSALMMAANNALSHTPPTTWLCYTSQGADASGKSNLHGGWGRGLGIITDDDVLGAWLREGGSASIGHRRWLLSPFLGQTSYGRVVVQSPDGSRATASSLRVFGFATTPPVPSAAAIPDFVAYPFGDYPARYFKETDYLSFTALAAKTGSFNGNERVSYAGATVAVTGPGGAMTVTDVQSDNAGYGVANAISWRVTGLVAGQTYTVTIQGVTGAARTSYTYSFRIL